MTSCSGASIFIGVVALAGVAIFLMREDRRSLPKPSLANQTEDLRGREKLNKPAISPVARRSLEMASWRNWATKEGATWLAGRNRDEVGLLAAWDLTGDEALLREAADRFPRGPLTCLALLNHLAQRDNYQFSPFSGEEQNWLRKVADEQRQWAERFIATAPENPLGYYHRALLAGQADLPAAMVALNEALSRKGRPNDYQRERMLALKEGMLTSGATEREACLMWMDRMVDASEPRGLTGAGGRLTSFFENGLLEMTGPEQQEDRQRFAELGLRVMEQARFSAAPTLRMEHRITYGRSICLRAMDPNTEIGDRGRMALAELKLWEVQRMQLQQVLSDGQTLLEDSARIPPDEVISLYTEIQSVEGTASAMRCLISEHKNGTW